MAGRQGRPTKLEQELRDEIKALKEELNRAKETADGNLEYAKQASKDVDRIQTEAFTKSTQIKELIETVSNALDMIDTISKLTRKALERDLTKDYAGQARQEMKQTREGE